MNNLYLSKNLFGLAKYENYKLLQIMLSDIQTSSKIYRYVSIYIHGLVGDCELSERCL